MREKSEIDKRLKKIRKELSSVNNEIESLDVKAEKSRGAARGPVSAMGGAGGGDSVRAGRRAAAQSTRCDARLADYLSTSFRSTRPLRRERRVQRNKAIVMSVFVLVILFWVVCHFFI